VEVIDGPMVSVQKGMSLSGEQDLSEISPKPHRSRRNQSRQLFREGNDDLAVTGSEPALVVKPRAIVYSGLTDIHADHLADLGEHVSGLLFTVIDLKRRHARLIFGVERGFRRRYHEGHRAILLDSDGDQTDVLLLLNNRIPKSSFADQLAQ